MDSRNYQLPILDTISTAWGKVYGSKGCFWGAFGMYVLIVIATAFIVGGINMFSKNLAQVINIVFQVYLTVLMYGFYYMGLMRASDAPINYKMLFRGIEEPARTLKLIIAVVLLWILLMIPLLIAAGITGMLYAMTQTGMNTTLAYILIGIIDTLLFAIFAFLVIRTSLTVLFILDRDEKPWEAIKASYKITKNNVWRMIGIYVLAGLIVIVSILPLCIGFIWTMPLAYLVLGTIYRRLSA